MVTKAIKTEDPAKQAEFTQCIGNFMKMVYQNYSKDNVNDETIKADLKLLSKGELKISDDQDINALARSNKGKPGSEQRTNNNKKGGGGKFRHGGGGGGQNRNKNFKKRR